MLRYFYLLSLTTYAQAAFTTYNVSSDNETTRDLIVGGSIVTSESYGSFAVTDPIFSNGLCGATLIHSDILISAAHCGEAEIFSEGTLLNIGGTSIFGDDAIDRIEVVNQLIHPNYNSNTLEYDVMLIQIATPSSAPISTWNNNPSLPANDESLTVVGFGRTELGFAAVFLHDATVNVVDIETCDAAYQLDVDGDLVLCAGSDSSSACSADSGGPLFRDGLLVGVVSFGAVSDVDGSCTTERELPNGYTRVSAVSSFITQGICTLAANPPTSCFAQTIPPVPAPMDPPVPAPTDRPSPIPTTPAPVTLTPTRAPVTSAPYTLSPFFFFLLTSSPTINIASASPSVRPSLSPTHQPSVIPSLMVSVDPTIDQSSVPSDVPSFIPTNVPFNTGEATESDEMKNITIITLPRPKADANNVNNTKPGSDEDSNMTSIGASVQVGYGSGLVMFGLLYGIFIVLL